MQKLQSFLDAAALAVQPIEEDPEKKKKLAKQWVHLPPWPLRESGLQRCSGGGRAWWQENGRGAPVRLLMGGCVACLCLQG
jgi:hypothetical protein